MATRCRGDLDRRPTGRLEPRSRPRLKAVSVTPEALRTGDGGDDGARRRQQRATGGVEIVVVVIVAQQHRVDRSRSEAAIAGPVSFRDPVPQPNR